MDIDQLKNSITLAFKTTRTKQAIINSYLPDIEFLINDLGYKLPAIIILLELDINIEHFRSLVRIARKKSNKDTNTYIHSTPEKTKQNPIQTSINNNPKESNEGWKTIFTDISPNLIDDIVSLDLSIDDVKALKVKHSMLNTKQLRKKINILLDDKLASKFQ